VSKAEELVKIDRNIKDIEIRIKTFSLNIEAIQKELDFLTNLEDQLQQNISYLKNIKVVALAIEYKKAREDLKKTKVRLLQLKSDKMINEKTYKELQNTLQKNKDIYDKLSKQDENNVLQGKFGRKRV